MYSILTKAFLLILCLCTALSAVALSIEGASAQGETRIYLSPTETLVGEEQTAAVEVRVENVEGLYGLDIRLSFDPAVVQVADADPNAGGLQVRPGDLLNLDFVLRNTADNKEGSIWFAMVQVNPSPEVSGSGIAFIVTFTGESAGSSTPLAIIHAEIVKRTGEGISAAIEDGVIRVVGPEEAPPTPTEAPPQPQPTIVTPTPTTPQPTTVAPTSRPTTRPTVTSTPQETTPSAENPTRPAAPESTATSTPNLPTPTQPPPTETSELAPTRTPAPGGTSTPSPANPPKQSPAPEVPASGQTSIAEETLPPPSSPSDAVSTPTPTPAAASVAAAGGGDQTQPLTTSSNAGTSPGASSENSVSIVLLSGFIGVLVGMLLLAVIIGVVWLIKRGSA